MSLTKQLIMAIALLMTFAFGGSFVVSSLSAKRYLEEQLFLKNIDNVNSLAASLSQMPKDPITIELLIAAYFDTGHYEHIRLVDPNGELLFERVGDTEPVSVPAWFVSLLSLGAQPGIAQVQDGWNQYGSLSLASHSRFAYSELWQSTIRLLIWFFAGAAISAIGGAIALRLITSPLRSVVAQAEAIGARRFITTPEPATLEFRAVVQSMNNLSRRVRNMLEEESLRLDQLRREAHFDQVTALLNRAHFVARVAAILEREDESAEGVLLIVRLTNLTELNRSQGWAVMDALIKRIAATLVEMAPEGADWVCGRLNGTDFALLAAGAESAQELAHQLSESLQLLARELKLETVCEFATAATAYRFDESLSALLTRADAALATAVEAGGNAVHVAALPTGTDASAEPAASGDFGEWRDKLDLALQNGWLKLDTFPVVDSGGNILHAECAARLRTAADGPWLNAGQFMPWLCRAGFSLRLDEQVIDKALERLRIGADDLCLNLAAQAMCDTGMMKKLSRQLGEAPELARRLWLEVPEHGAFQHLDQFRVMCALLKPTGCRVGIEHIGHQVAQIGKLHDLGLDYIKIDASFIRRLDENQANQVYLRGLTMIAHSIGLSAYAEGVQREEEFATLVELGFDGATGPAVTRREGSD